MPYSVDERHSPSEFYYPRETNYSNATFQGEDNDKTATKTAKKMFSGLFYKCQKKLRFNKAI